MRRQEQRTCEGDRVVVQKLNRRPNNRKRMFRYTSTKPIRLYYPHTSECDDSFSFNSIHFYQNDGICCKEFKLMVYCSICDVSVSVSYIFYFRFVYKDSALRKINDRVSLSHNHKDILEKLIRVKCDAAGKDFYVNGSNIASIEDRKCVGMKLSDDVLCGLCDSPGVSSQYENHPADDVDIKRLTNLPNHYGKHTELRKTESVDIVIAAEQIYNATLDAINELEKSDLFEKNKVP